MAVINPPAWLQAGNYPARNDRLALTGLMSYSGFSFDEATPLRIRQGVKPSYQNYQLKVRAASTPNMTVIVSGGVCFIDQHDTGGVGTYICANDGDVTLTVQPAGGAGQYRKDCVVASVYDAEYSGSASEWRLEVIQGAYAASAGATVRPALPSNAQLLADLAIGPSQTSVTNANIGDVRIYSVAAGGIVPILSTVDMDRPAPGQVRYRTDTDTFVYGKGDGTTGQLLSSAGSPWLTAYKSADESVSNATLQDDDHLFVSLAANATYLIDGLFIYTGQTFAAGPGDLRAVWSIPAGSTLRWSRNGPSQNAATGMDIVSTDESTVRLLGTFGGGTDVSAHPKGRITTAGTAGLLRLRWAQGTTNAAQATIMRAGSWLRVQRIA
ncbi:hypothetical protein ACSCBZ_24855 [Streptomyces niveiscabiei]|uniref:hypothetical protein n=1 Tax=Streptomyces niveiscabiei TaxID=164115 RepID=UPI0006EB4967|nr:hypothetical protein [Streptomyces niveiscabiei]